MHFTMPLYLFLQAAALSALSLDTPWDIYLWVFSYLYAADAPSPATVLTLAGCTGTIANGIEPQNSSNAVTNEADL